MDDLAANELPATTPAAAGLPVTGLAAAAPDRPDLAGPDLTGPDLAGPVPDTAATNGAASGADVPPDTGSARTLGWILTGAVLAVLAGYVWLNLHPSLLLKNTTPAGGDMGAHVWGPAYLRDHLLPDFRLTGWTKDWYAGFPAYQYYMVVPALMIVALDLFLPYAVAFKLISVAGLVAMPLCAAYLGRGFGMRFPGPAILGVMTLPFLWDTTWTIYGGNVASNLAGEFSFTLALCFALLFFGSLARGLETGRKRARAAVLFALVGLCHPLPLLGLVIPGLVAVGLWHIGAILSASRPAPGADVARTRPGALRSSLWWGVSALGVGSALTAFWMAPFILKGDYLNDMGWVRLPTNLRSVGYHLFHLGSEDGTLPLFDGTHKFSNVSMWLWAGAVVFAVVGAVLATLMREKIGIVLLMTAALTATGFLLMPQHRFWNARILPFWYLSIYLLGGVGLALLISWLRPIAPRILYTVAVTGAVLALVGVGLGNLGSPVNGRNVWDLGPVALGDRSNFTTSWARWNYEGYEGKSSYPEYRAVVNEMDRLGQNNGCGRAMWEYDNERLNKFGTPMALMLLPHWTDGCIGSMEGLFFESSPTTPFHFLNQSELSARPSRPQNELAYRDTNVDQGVRHLQLLGVRYFLAFSERVITSARANPDLRELSMVAGDDAAVAAERALAAPSQDRIDRALPWVIFEVSGSELVEPVRNLPAVVEGIDDGQHEWLDPAVEYYNDPSRWDVLQASDGPDGWPRMGVDDPAPKVSTPAVTVSKIRETEDTISFEVDRVGSPVLVKASYFPNWEVDGALGPYRVMPNLMVVVPTEERVTLSYGYTSVDYAGYGVTALGLVGLVVLATRRRGLRTLPEVREPASQTTQLDLVGGGESWAELAAAGAGVTARIPGTTPDLPGALEPVPLVGAPGLTGTAAPGPPPGVAAGAAPTAVVPDAAVLSEPTVGADPLLVAQVPAPVGLQPPDVSPAPAVFPARDVPVPVPEVPVPEVPVSEVPVAPVDRPASPLPAPDPDDDHPLVSPSTFAPLIQRFPTRAVQPAPSAGSGDSPAPAGPAPASNGHHPAAANGEHGNGAHGNGQGAPGAAHNLSGNGNGNGNGNGHAEPGDPHP